MYELTYFLVYRLAYGKIKVQLEPELQRNLHTRVVLVLWGFAPVWCLLRVMSPTYVVGLVGVRPFVVPILCNVALVWCWSRRGSFLVWG